MRLRAPRPRKDADEAVASVTPPSPSQPHNPWIRHCPNSMHTKEPAGDARLKPVFSEARRPRSAFRLISESQGLVRKPELAGLGLSRTRTRSPPAPARYGPCGPAAHRDTGRRINGPASAKRLGARAAASETTGRAARAARPTVVRPSESAGRPRAIRVPPAPWPASPARAARRPPAGRQSRADSEGHAARARPGARPGVGASRPAAGPR